MPLDEAELPSDPVALSELAGTQAIHLDFMEERIAELELELEDVGWLRENGQATFEFQSHNLLRMINWARIMYLKNPLINHGVEVQADYVFAQGVTIASTAGDDSEHAKALASFISHPKNKAELFDLSCMWMKDVRQQTEGNIFFALFVKKGSPVVIRTIPVEDILGSGDIIRNPEDRREPWYYKRKWRAEVFNEQTGEITYEDQCAYYPDWQYEPKTGKRLTTIGEHPVHWDIRIYHLKTGGTDEMKYGMPEVYQALPWARATVRDLEDYATVKRALARFAWNVSTKGGKPAIDAVRTKLKTSVTRDASVERNPAPAVGSVWAGAEGYNLDPIKTAGAQPESNSGRAIRVMVGTGLGLPDTILSGDAATGSLATGKTLDRPTELKMLKRQQMWASIFMNLCTFSIAVQTKDDMFTDDNTYSFTESNTIEDLGRKYGIRIAFPPVLERDAKGRVDAVISAATLDGKSKAHTMTDKILIGLLAQALGMDNELEEWMSKLKFDEDDNLLLPEPVEIPGMPGMGSPGGPTPGPKPGAPLDRQAQNLDKNEPSATQTEFPYMEAVRRDPDAFLRSLSELRTKLERGELGVDSMAEEIERVASA